MLESSTPGGNVSWIRFSVLLEIQLLMAIRAFSGSSYRTGPGVMDERPPTPAVTPPDLEVERQQLGAVHHLADVLVGPIEGQRLVPEQAVGRNQLRGLVLLPVQAAVELGEEKVDLIRRLLLDGVKLKHLRAQTHWLPGPGRAGGTASGPGLTLMSCSRVWLQAPSLVMAKAVEMLMGDVKMLDSGLLLAATCL